MKPDGQFFWITCVRCSKLAQRDIDKDFNTDEQATAYFEQLGFVFGEAGPVCKSCVEAEKAAK